VPPLRERAPDILPLARAFLAESARRWRRPDLRLTPAAEARLAAHAWPGNVRELKNVVEQAAVMAAGDMIGPDDLGLAELGEPAPPAAAPPGGEASGRPGTELPPLGEAERELLLQALRRAAWNVSAAARLLGVSRDVVRYRMQKHGLLRPPA
jgi:DNA-binding NtrC family response regulator